MKSFTGNFSSVRGWALLLALLLGAGMLISACGDEEVPAPTTPTPPPAPPPAPEPEPEPTGPATPANLRVTAMTSNSITWTWDPVEGVFGYEGQFSTNAAFTNVGNPFIIIAPATSQTVSNLSGNTTGYFRVRSGTGSSSTDLTYGDWTEGVSGSTDAPPAATEIDAPSNFRSTETAENSITLEWDEVDEAETYEVEQRVAGGTWADASCGGEGEVVDDPECEATGLTRGTEYTFRVAAVPDATDRTVQRSVWTVLENSVRTAGSIPRPLPTGGSGDLNITWRSQNVDASTRNITWRWDQAGDVDYQIKVLEGALDAEMPCEDRSEEWDMANRQLGTSHNVELSANGARLLCVRATWLDSGGERQYGDPSWAWAATQPTDPLRPTGGAAVEYEAGEGITESVSWSVSLAGAGEIQYEFRYLINELSKDDDFTALTDPDSDSQSRCEAATSAEMLTPGGSGFSTFTTSGDLKDYSAYHLCYRAQNDSGRSDWALATASGAEIYTAPGPVGVSGSCRVNPDDAAAMSCEWTVTPPSSGPSLPKTNPSGSVATFYQFRAVQTRGDDRNQSVAADDVAEVCQLQTDTTDIQASGPTLTLTTDTTKVTERRFAVTATPSREAAGDTASDYYVYVCARANHDGGSDAETELEGKRPGPWKVSGGARVTKQS